MTAFNVHPVRTPAEMAELAPEWEALERSMSPRLPFTSFLWNSLWWEHFRAQQLLVRDDFFVHVVRDGRGRLAAVAPMMLTQRPAAGPLRVRSVQFFGADGNVTEVRGLVCAPQVQGEAIRALLCHFERHSRRWDWIEWRGLRSGCTAEARRPSLDGAFESTIPLYYLSLPASWDDLRATLSRNTKESIRHCYNSLARGGHRWRFLVARTPDGVAGALERFFDLHAARSRLMGVVPHPNLFQSSVRRRFLTELCLRLAARGETCVFQLEVEGEIAATRVAFLLGDELYLYYSGYDPRWAKFSVMTTLLIEAFKWSIERRLRVANLSTGQDVSKMRWRPECLMLGQAVTVAPTIGGRIALRAYQEIGRCTRPGSVLGWALAAARRNT